MKKSGSGWGYRLVVDFPFNHTLYASLKSSITAGVSALNFGTSTLKGRPPCKMHWRPLPKLTCDLCQLTPMHIELITKTTYRQQRTCYNETQGQNYENK